MQSDEAIKHAIDGLRLLDIFQSNEGGQWFLGQIEEKVAGLERRILDDDMSPAAREDLRQQRQALREILKIPAEYQAGQENILRSAGIMPGHQLLQGGGTSAGERSAARR